MCAKRGRPRTGAVPNSSIRIRPEALGRAKKAAKLRKTTMGRWLEEAISEKIDREDSHTEGSMG
jgi:hypothetical protein